MGRLADAIRDGVAMPDPKRRQILLLDEEFSELEAENQVLKAENLRLQAKVNPLERENQRLKERIKHQDSAALDDVSEAMLLLIANGGVSKEALAQRLNLSKAKSDYHFSVLEKNGFAHELSYFYDSTAIGATPEGLEYLASRGKL